MVLAIPIANVTFASVFAVLITPIVPKVFIASATSVSTSAFVSVSYVSASIFAFIPALVSIAKRKVFI
jgi:hypothetical protein